MKLSGKLHCWPKDTKEKKIVDHGNIFQLRNFLKFSITIISCSCRVVCEFQSSVILKEQVEVFIPSCSTNLFNFRLLFFHHPHSSISSPHLFSKEQSEERNKIVDFFLVHLLRIINYVHEIVIESEKRGERRHLIGRQ